MEFLVLMNINGYNLIERSALMGRIICIYITLIIASIFTINAYWIGLNNQTTIEMFNRLPLLFAPSNYVYLLWFIVIALLFIYFMTFKKENQSLLFKSNLQVSLLICSVAFHVITLYFWHYDLILTAVILGAASLLITFSLYITYPLTSESIKYRTPIALLFSWQIFIFILMFNYTLMTFEWSGFGISDALWTVIFLTGGTAVALHLRYHHYDILAPIVFTWCYIGIAFSNGLSELLVTIAALFLCGVMIAGIYLLKKKKLSI